MATITAITATTTTATNSSTNPSYSVRLGRSSDIDALAPIYLASFEHDTLLDFLFPLRRSHPADMAVGLHRLFQLRYWSAEYVLTVLDDGQGRAVGFAWWKKPVVRQPVWKKWCSPSFWLSHLIHTYVHIKNYFDPLKIDSYAAGIFERSLEPIKKGFLNSPRRQQAWYLSSVAVYPSLQGKGLGSMLLIDGLQRADRSGGAAAWLIGVAGVEAFYQRHGFVEVGRANVGELSGWDGGSVMFRE